MEPTDELREGRRNLSGINGYELIEDLTWDNRSQKWYFKFRLTGDYKETEFVPISTEWYCIVSHQYPDGGIEIYPDAAYGITDAFPHMSHNAATKDKLWRSGNICVKTSMGLWGKAYYNSEPQDSANRLPWYISRSIAWVKAAAEGQLTQPGDPFELPDFPKRSIPVWAFCEDAKSFQHWSTTSERTGLARCKPFGGDNAVTVMEFLSPTRNPLFDYTWGKAIMDNKKGNFLAFWCVLDKIPVVLPWKIPETWKELFKVCKDSGFDLHDWLIKRLEKNQNITNIRHLMLGFPIPEKFGEDAYRMHWFAIELPEPKPVTGFRKNTEAYHQCQAKIMLRDENRIKWLLSENWAKDQITTRGNVNAKLQDKNILVVGVGALGSLTAELLVRLGCNKITIVDHDLVKVGNFSRHSLTMSNIPSLKAQSVAKRLNLIFPFVSVDYHAQHIEDCLDENEHFLDTFDLIIDATANYDALRLIGEKTRERPATLVSVSTSIEAKRLYCYLARTDMADAYTNFIQLLAPWSQKEKDENPNPQFPLDGVGCWHPVFPARIDDILTILSPAIRQIESFIAAEEPSILFVTERNDDGSVKSFFSK